jgi:hypothetical protein
VGISREVWDLRDSTPPNKEKTFPNKKKHHQTRKPPFKQEKYLSSKETSFKQAGGIFHSNIEVYKW